jgi:hypothetical protein
MATPRAGTRRTSRSSCAAAASVPGLSGTKRRRDEAIAKMWSFSGLGWVKPGETQGNPGQNGDQQIAMDTSQHF